MLDMVERRKLEKQLHACRYDLKRSLLKYDRSLSDLINYRNCHSGDFRISWFWRIFYRKVEDYVGFDFSLAGLELYAVLVRRLLSVRRLSARIEDLTDKLS